MAAAILLLLLVMLIGGIGINVSLRSWVREQSRREAHLRDPHTHTVAYAIPNRGCSNFREGLPRWRESVSIPASTASACSIASASSATTPSVSGPAVPSKASG